jgi:hypothetical protein
MIGARETQGEGSSSTHEGAPGAARLRWSGTDVAAGVVAQAS